MKIIKSSPAQVVFTKHSEKNRKYSQGREKWLTLGKIYTITYDQYNDPCITSDDNTLCSGPMAVMDYDIISQPSPQKGEFAPVSVVLESEEDIMNMARIIGADGNYKFAVELLGCK